MVQQQGHVSDTYLFTFVHSVFLWTTSPFCVSFITPPTYTISHVYMYKYKCSLCVGVPNDSNRLVAATSFHPVLCEALPGCDWACQGPPLAAAANVLRGCCAPPHDRDATWDRVCCDQPGHHLNRDYLFRHEHHCLEVSAALCENGEIPIWWENMASGEEPKLVCFELCSAWRTLNCALFLVACCSTLCLLF